MAVDLNRQDWIATTREAAVDPNRRIVDPHIHLWSEREMGAGKYLFAELLADARARHNVTHAVFVEPGSGSREDGPEHLRPVGVTEFVAEQAVTSREAATRIGGIVAYADLKATDRLGEVLDAHEEAGRGYFRGIRHGMSWDADTTLLGGQDPGLITNDDFRRGVAFLGERGYSFDAWLYHPQLPALASLADAAAGTTIIVDHLGVPLYGKAGADRETTRGEWREGMKALAAHTNVLVKIGGIGMEFVYGRRWSVRPAAPTSDELVAWWGDDIRWVIDTFTPQRCMFESNYPVDRQAAGYTVLWNTFQKIAADYTEDEQAALFAGTAERAYRITD
ncbi:amidohydrolase family protein [Streptomyces muensis]|uniref:Amidohydrolase family protein n=1 Tax=Streptomyces muensis TaxID=1077944 RepID=A0A9X1PSJ9_STRM4|nr:amidohydrolase family protein [Streptomyces muensis]MCF1592328.1 amidohydrolase family protein [Streptomyces muensis]